MKLDITGCWDFCLILEPRLCRQVDHFHSFSLSPCVCLEPSPYHCQEGVKNFGLHLVNVEQQHLLVRPCTRWGATAPLPDPGAALACHGEDGGGQRDGHPLPNCSEFSLSVTGVPLGKCHCH